MNDDIELSPFQKRCIERGGNRIVLQPRRTGSTVMQAHLAADRADDKGVLHLAPETGGCDAFLHALPGRSKPNHIRSFAVGDDSARGQAVSTIIVDQPQPSDAEPFRMIYGPIVMTRPNVEVVLAATGRSKGRKETALDVAMRSGEFSLIWTDLVDGLVGGDLHNDPHAVAGGTSTGP